jgi:hypothetical protein
MHSGDGSRSSLARNEAKDPARGLLINFGQGVANEYRTLQWRYEI